MKNRKNNNNEFTNLMDALRPDDTLVMVIQLDYVALKKHNFSWICIQRNKIRSIDFNTNIKYDDSI